MLSGRTPGEAVVSERLMFAESYAASLRTPDTALLYRFDPTAPHSDERPGPGPEPGRPAGEGRVEVYDRRADARRLLDSAVASRRDDLLKTVDYPVVKCADGAVPLAAPVEPAKPKRRATKG